MDFIFELILELALEGGIEASKSSKIPKVIRYPLIFIICLFFLGVIGLTIFVGISTIRDYFLGGLFIILIGLFLLIAGIIKFKKVYLNRIK